MTVAAQKMTFDEFLSYDDGTDNWYELENGELIAMPAESEINRRIAMFLVANFTQAGYLVRSPLDEDGNCGEQYQGIGACA
jgi:Uma2 family endonuclease